MADPRNKYELYDRTYRRNTANQSPVMPVTKVVMRRKPVPRSDTNKDVIRFRFLEPPFRFWHAMTFYQQVFAKTAFFSFLLTWPTYEFVKYIARLKSRAEITAKMDAGFTSDDLKLHIIDYNRRQRDGKIERFDSANPKTEFMQGEDLFKNKGKINVPPSSV